jgi:transcriptional regulator with XRE-family HTH domain
LTNMDNVVWEIFRTELLELRLRLKLTQNRFGDRIGFSGDFVGNVERGERPPKDGFWQAVDTAFKTGGLFMRLAEKALGTQSVFPEWFKDYVDAEQRASVLRTWEPMLVPGLLQTEPYARAVYDSWRASQTPEWVEEQVSARMARQRIFGRPFPPAFRVLMDEAVLHRRAGSREIMYDQLSAIVAQSEQHRISIQVVPSEVGTHRGLGSAFNIAGFEDATPGMCFVESSVEGTTSASPDTLDTLVTLFDSLRDEALSVSASRDLIRRVAEEIWKDNN